MGDSNTVKLSLPGRIVGNSVGSAFLAVNQTTTKAAEHPPSGNCV